MYRVRLSCGHTIEVKTLSTHQNGLTEKCPIHDRYFDVNSWTRDEWHSRCLDCPYSRTHGQAKVYAEAAAEAHRRRFPSHTVGTAYYNRTPKTEIDAPLPSLMLPGFNDDDTPPPF